MVVGKASHFMPPRKAVEGARGKQEGGRFQKVHATNFKKRVNAQKIIVHTNPTYAAFVSKTTPDLNAHPENKKASLPPKLPTPINVQQLKLYIKGYSTHHYQYLIDGFSYGFSLKCENVFPTPEPKNLKSALIQPHIVSAKLMKELTAGRLLGPFKTPPYSLYKISPIGLQPKKSPGEFRLIHHLSYPKGLSINDGIPHELATVQYATINHAIQIIKQLGRGCYLAKTDIESAFKIVPVRPEECNLLGFKWENDYYFDSTLPMGCSSSCAIFEEFSSALQWAAKDKMGIQYMIHILDDFLIVNHTLQDCQTDLNTFLQMCANINVPMSREKTIGPATCISFAGIELDTLQMLARLPVDKVKKCFSLIDSFLERKSVTLREMQSLIGTLNFACTVILPGRAFLRRLIDVTKGIKKPHHHIRINNETKKDLYMWCEFLRDYNCKSFFLSDNWFNSESLALYTDSSASLGFGGLMGQRWFYGAWSNEILVRKLNIAILELYPIVVALYLWGSDLANKRISIFSDNLAVVDIINKQTSKEPRIMCLLRQLVLTCLRYNILIKSCHVPGHMNVLADHLSRLQVARFKMLCPLAQSNPTPVPSGLRLEQLMPT